MPSLSLIVKEVELFCLFLAEVRCIDNLMFHLMKYELQMKFWELILFISKFLIFLIIYLCGSM